MEASAIMRTAVVGGGLMGAGFAQIFAKAGCRVRVVDVSRDQLELCLRRVREGLATLVQNGLLDPVQVEPILGRIEVTTSLEEGVGDAQFVIEAVTEKLEVKREVFEKLDRHSPVEAILTTNTSGLPVTAIAEWTLHPERVVGSHFFYPPYLMPLVEVGYGEKTSDEAVATAVSFWKRCGKEPVVCRKDSNGFLVNRLQSALVREAISLVQKGVASAADVDRAIRFGLGMRMPLWGPLEQRDWSGLAVHMAAASSIYPTLEDSKEPLLLLADKVARGDNGTSTGKGFFDWRGRDVVALRAKRNSQFIALMRALKEIMPEEEELADAEP